MKIRTAILLACTGLLSHSANAADAVKQRDCLFANQTQNWRVLDRQQLILWGPSQKVAYLVKLFAPMSDLPFAEALAFIDDDKDGMICGNGGDKIAMPNSTASSFPTTITSMRKVDDAELLALGEQYKMKLISDKKAQALKGHDKQVHE